MKTATQLERAYRLRLRKAGEKQVIVKIDLDPDVDRYCELRGISRSEYLTGLVYRAANDSECRELTLPTHVWKFVDSTAAAEGHRDLSKVFLELYDDARVYRAMVAPSRRRAKKEAA